MAHGDPLCWHRSSPTAKAKGADAKRASRDAAYPGDIIPVAGEIISERRATSPGIRIIRPNLDSFPAQRLLEAMREEFEIEASEKELQFTVQKAQPRH
jgi:hypothetical protein